MTEPRCRKNAGAVFNMNYHVLGQEFPALKSKLPSL